MSEAPTDKLSNANRRRLPLFGAYFMSKENVKKKPQKSLKEKRREKKEKRAE